VPLAFCYTNNNTEYRDNKSGNILKGLTIKVAIYRKAQMVTQMSKN